MASVGSTVWGLVSVPTFAQAHEHGSTTATATANIDLLVFLAVGLFAGAHCLGMCGPLVTTYADRFNPQRNTARHNTLTLYEVRQHALFNLGRAGSYALLGGVFGLLGALAFMSVDAVVTVGNGVRATVGILVGIAIIASGAYYLRGRSGIPHGVPIFGSAFAWVSRRLTARVDRLANSPRIAALGAIHGLLPCPIIYPAYLYAFALADPIRGALSLGILGLGTIPALFIYGTALGSLTTANRVRLHRVLGAAFIALGYIPLQHGLMLYGVHLPHPPIPFYQPL